MKAYVINLPEAVERLEHVSNNLEKFSLDYEIVEGIRGANLVLPHKDYAELSYNLMHGKRTNLSEVGCYFSHIKALDIFLKSGDTHGLILEDDITFNENFNDVLSQALTHTDKWDLLRLSGLHAGTSVKILSLTQDYSLSCNITRQTGAGAYIVNQNAAELMIKHLLPMKLPYDHAFDTEWNFNIRTMFVTPPPIDQKNGFQSQISSTRKGRKFRSYRYITVFPSRTYRELNRLIYRVVQVIKYKFFSFRK